MKKIIVIILFSLLVLGILYISFNDMNKEDIVGSTKKDVFEKVNIDGTNISVNFYEGNMIDDSISYGNKLEKIIEINNDSNKDVAFALYFDEVNISDNKLIYNLYYSYDLEEYNPIKERISIIKDENIAYNLVVQKKSKIGLKVDFIGNNESEETKIKGKFNIVTNLTDKDIFKSKINEIHSALLNKIKNINGINTSGYYIVDLNIFDDYKDEFKGYIFIDAKDYGDIKYHYSVYNDKFMLDDLELKNGNLNKKDILDYNKSTYTFDSVCKKHTKKECTDFNTLGYDPNGGKDVFYKNSIDVINQVKNTFSKTDKKVYIIDVTKDINNSTNIRGYILINNTIDNPEYYIYLTNDIYMVSGYNLTKLGEYKKDSKTIRAYSASSFSLSSENESKVCSFSGFNECFKYNEEKVS